MKLHEKYYELLNIQEELINRKNVKSDFYNGIYSRWCNPVLTRDHIPLSWRYDLNPESNPFFQERLAVNAVFNAGAIKFNGKYCLAARVEGADRKASSLSLKAITVSTVSASATTRLLFRISTKMKQMSTICV